jgi:hypothetical protein
MSKCGIVPARRPRRAGIAATAVALALPAAAEAITLQDLKDVNIETQSVYDATVRRPEGDFRSQMTVVLRFQVDEEGRMRGEVKRTVSTPFGPRTQTNPMFARIGQPGDLPRGGQGLWLIDGDKLILLRALEQGGFKVEIDFKGAGKSLTCNARAPLVREEGKSEIKSQQSVVGGPVTYLNATEKSTKCRIIRQ